MAAAVILPLAPPPVGAAVGKIKFREISFGWAGAPRAGRTGGAPVITVRHDGRRWVPARTRIAVTIRVRARVNLGSSISRISVCMAACTRNSVKDIWAAGYAGGRRKVEITRTAAFPGTPLGGFAAGAAEICNRRGADPRRVLEIPARIPVIVDILAGRGIVKVERKTARVERRLYATIRCAGRPARTAPPFRVTRASLTFEPAPGTSCPRTVAMILQVWGTGWGAVDIRLRRDDQRVVYRGRLNIRRQRGAVFGAVHRVVSRIRQTHNHQYRLETAAGRTLTPWQPLRMRCAARTPPGGSRLR